MEISRNTVPGMRCHASAGETSSPTGVSPAHELGWLGNSSLPCPHRSGITGLVRPQSHAPKQLGSNKPRLAPPSQGTGFGVRGAWTFQSSAWAQHPRPFRTRRGTPCDFSPDPVHKAISFPGHSSSTCGPGSYLEASQGSTEGGSFPITGP